MASEKRYVPVTFTPGLHRNTTEYGAESNWFSADKVRFRSGQPETWGGYQKQPESSFTGTARNITQWSSLKGEIIGGIGTNNHLYLWVGGAFNDITPAQVSATQTTGITTSLGAVSVVVSLTNHSASPDDFVYFASAHSVGNVSLGGNEYLVSSVIDSNTLVVLSSVAADSTQTSVGTVNWVKLIPSGQKDSTESQGFGRSSFGSGPFGLPDPSATGINLPVHLWSLNPWGEDLLVNPRGGGLYLWDYTNGIGDKTNRAVIVSAAPSIIDYSFVSNPTHHVVAVGTTDWSTGVYDPLLVRWCTDSDYTDWVPSGTNTAGDYRLTGGSKTLGVRQAKLDTLIWTDAELHKMTYTGDPLYFTFDRLGSNAGKLGPQSSAEKGNTIFWMSPSGFYRYDGAITQLACPFSQDIFDIHGPYQIDLKQREKTFCGINSAFAEVIWLYQTVGSTTGEVDRYVTYNYNEDTWADGYINRTTWLDKSLFDSVIATGDDGFIYKHELGHDTSNDPMSTYLESAAFDLENGDKVLIVNRIIPDFDYEGDVDIKVYTKMYPNQDTWTDHGTYQVDNQGKIDLRGVRGREAKIRIETNDSDAHWQLGKLRIQVKENGKR